MSVSNTRGSSLLNLREGSLMSALNLWEGALMSVKIHGKPL